MLWTNSPRKINCLIAFFSMVRAIFDGACNIYKKLSLPNKMYIFNNAYLRGVLVYNMVLGNRFQTSNYQHFAVTERRFRTKQLPYFEKGFRKEKVP